MQSKICMRYFISGRVQGVWFRASAQEEAKKLDLTGWARNLPDGRVEVLACGDEEKLKQFHQWLQQGPELSKVDNVICEQAKWENFERFLVK